MKKHLKKVVISGLIVAGLLAITLYVVFPGILQPKVQPLVEEHSGIALVHAQPNDPTTGCAKCHTAPITVDCTTCHTPETQIGNIAFPHHDVQSPPGIGCQNPNCHDGTEGDARYVIRPNFNHNYCMNCHTIKHSSPG